MRGTIVHYNATEGRGLIAARDGAQYPFAITAWRTGIAPRVNQTVELQTDRLRVTAVRLVPAHVVLAGRIAAVVTRLRLLLAGRPSRS